MHEDGTVATRPTGEVPPLHVLEAGARELLAHSSAYVRVPPLQPTAETIARAFLEVGHPVPNIVQALNARQAALLGDTPQVDAFTSDVLGLWSGWREPVSTALLGDWASPLLNSGSLAPTTLDHLRAEARIPHRQLAPVSRHRIAGERLWSLDFRFGDDLTLYDLVSGGPDPYEVLTGALPDDPRVATVLAQLRPIEYAVAMVRVPTSSPSIRHSSLLMIPAPSGSGSAPSSFVSANGTPSVPLRQPLGRDGPHDPDRPAPNPAAGCGHAGAGVITRAAPTEPFRLLRQ
ncbi:hypothetical protein ACFY4I_17570 [Streptomyces scabiei]|uniref:hypothetical protein n=1 Tax=Streptomyces scabiei TaxID=1930 RepID=UPI0036809ED6